MHENIKNEMRMYRYHGYPLPQSYIDVHEKYAREDLKRFLDKHSLTGIKTEMVNDGWGDGMMRLAVTVVDPNGNTQIYHWGDANGGSWWKKGCGSLLVEIPDHRPGYL